MRTEANTKTRGVRVTIEDLATGERESQEITDDYAIVCTGSCYLAHVQRHGNGTDQLTIRGRAV